MFDAFFGGDAFGRFGGGGETGPRRGADAELTLELTLHEVVFGARKTVEPRMPIECEVCGGSGAAPGTHTETCPTCEGRGEVRQVRRSLLGQLVTAAPCQACAGTGELIPSPCETCRGDGRVHGTRTLDVDVPAGIDEGQRLRLAQRGPAAPRGGVPGDLYVNVRVPATRTSCDRATTSSTARRSRSSRRRSAPCSCSRRSTETKSSRSTRAPSTARSCGCRGLGVPSLRNGRRGDLVCEIAVEIPRNLTAEEAELLAQFAALRGEDVQTGREGLFSRIRSAFQ